MPVSDRKIQDIVDLKGMKKDQIYTKSLEWIASSFNSGKSVLEHKDKEGGKIIGNVSTSFMVAITTIDVKSSMVIDVKDAKARITVTPIDTYYDGRPRGVYESEFDKIKESIDGLISNYRNFMTSKADSSW